MQRGNYFKFLLRGTRGPCSALGALDFALPVHPIATPLAACEFGELADSLIRDGIVVGIRDGRADSTTPTSRQEADAPRRSRHVQGERGDGTDIASAQSCTTSTQAAGWQASPHVKSFQRTASVMFTNALTLRDAKGMEYRR